MLSQQSTVSLGQHIMCWDKGKIENKPSLHTEIWGETQERCENICGYYQQVILSSPFAIVILILYTYLAKKKKKQTQKQKAKFKIY